MPLSLSCRVVEVGALRFWDISTPPSQAQHFAFRRDSSGGDGRGGGGVRLAACAAVDAPRGAPRLRLRRAVVGLRGERRSPPYTSQSVDRSTNKRTPAMPTAYRVTTLWTTAFVFHAHEGLGLEALG